MRYLFTALFALFLASEAEAVPFPICDDPGGAGIPAGYLIVEHEMIENGLTRWYCVVTPAGYSASGPDYPVVFVFHGGNGNPQNLMDPDKRFLAEGLTRGYVLVFPAGIGDPVACDPAEPCEDNFWGDASNVGFVNSLIAEAASYNLDEDRIYLAGFSGGAKLIYEAIEADSFPYPIAAIATAAGSLGTLKVDAPESGFPIVNVVTGTSTDALLFQGEADPKMAFAGGLSDGASEVQLSFTVKVDLFRALTGNATDPGTDLSTGGATVTSYTLGTHEVLAVSEPGTGHTWPRGLTRTAFDFFDTH
jgi:poly(3-hydroxybutyrate) depolymerase